MIADRILNDAQGIYPYVSYIERPGENHAILQSLEHAGDKNSTFEAFIVPALPLQELRFRTPTIAQGTVTHAEKLLRVVLKSY